MCPLFPDSVEEDKKKANLGSIGVAASLPMHRHICFTNAW